MSTPMSIFASILIVALAIVLVRLLAATSIKIRRSDRQSGDSAFRVALTLVWPSGPVTYSWPRK